MLSTVTYSLQIYSPDTNVDHVQEVRVRIVGEESIRTKENTVIDLANRPQTETQGYVKYQTLETVFYHISKHRERSWKYGAQQAIFGNFQGAWNVVKNCLNYVVYLLNRKWSKGKNKMRSDVPTPPGFLLFSTKPNISYIQPSRRARSGSQENVLMQDCRTF